MSFIPFSKPRPAREQTWRVMHSRQLPQVPNPDDRIVLYDAPPDAATLASIEDAHLWAPHGDPLRELPSLIAQLPSLVHLSIGPGAIAADILTALHADMLPASLRHLSIHPESGTYHWQGGPMPGLESLTVNATLRFDPEDFPALISLSTLPDRRGTLLDHAMRLPLMELNLWTVPFDSSLFARIAGADAGRLRRCGIGPTGAGLARASAAREHRGDAITGASLMNLLHERFLDHLSARGWTVLRTAPRAVIPASPAGSEAHAVFLSLFTQLSCADDTRWFLSATDYAGTAESAFNQDTFRDISLEAAISDADRQMVETFWARHVPLFISVDGEYEFLALDRISGAVVHGAEPEFEAVSEMAPSLESLFNQMLAGGKAAALLG